MSRPTDAEGEFARRYRMTPGEAYAFLYPYARHLADDRHEADDLLQGFLLKLLQGLTRTATVREPRAFLRTSLATHRIDELRKKIRYRNRHVLRDVLPETEGSAAAEVVSTHEIGDWMTSVLGAEDAALVWRHVVDGETQDAMATALGMSSRTLGDRIRRALRKLRADQEGEDA